MVKKKAVKKSDDKFFKFFLLGFVIIVIVAAILLNNKGEQEIVIVNEGDVVMHYFYFETCVHCKVQEKYHKVLIEKYPNLKIIEYEMSKSSSRDKYLELANEVGLDVERIATPTTVIGSEFNVGYLNDEVTGLKLESMIEKELNKNNSN